MSSTASGEIHHSFPRDRATGAAAAQDPAAAPLAQSRPSAAPQIFTRTSQTNSVFHPSLPRKPDEHRPGLDLAQKFDRWIPVAAGCVGLRGCASHPRRPKSDSLFGGAGRNNRPQTAAPRGECGLSLASLVALWCSLAVVCYSIFYKCAILRYNPKA